MSKQNELTKDDLVRRSRDLLVFLAPMLIIMLENFERLGMEATLRMGGFLLLSAIADLLRRFMTNYRQDETK